jgi:hypothetical protein
MINICTLSDINYLNLGICLYDSIAESCSEDFVMHYLCIDNRCYETLKKRETETLKVYSIQDIESTDDFQSLVNNTTYTPMSSDVSNTYCFSLASFFSKFLLDTQNIEDIIYTDADVLFYNNISDIHRLASKKSIGLMLHRHNDLGCHVGGYNVGLIYFKNDNIGYDCLTWWRDCVINPKNEWAKEYGTCGDQKYLEAFPIRYGSENICVIDEEIGHGAPWNMGLYDYVTSEIGGEFVWRPYGHRKERLNLGIDFHTKKQKMYFVHFSQFNPDYENSRYGLDRNGCWRGLGIYENQNVINYYNDYFLKTKKYKDLG